MRVSARPAVGLVAVVTYIAIVAVLWKALGVDYNTALLPAMALHALWDFGSLGASASDTTTPLFVGLLFQLTLIVSLVAAWQIIRAMKASLTSPSAIRA